MKKRTISVTVIIIEFTSFVFDSHFLLFCSTATKTVKPSNNFSSVPIVMYHNAVYFMDSAPDEYILCNHNGDIAMIPHYIV